jgi:hypothetical protein
MKYQDQVVYLCCGSNITASAENIVTVSTDLHTEQTASYKAEAAFKRLQRNSSRRRHMS